MWVGVRSKQKKGAGHIWRYGWGFEWGAERPFCSQFAVDLQGPGVKHGYTGGVLIIRQAVGFEMRGTAVWPANWGLASGVWRGGDAGHSSERKTAPEQVSLEGMTC